MNPEAAVTTFESETATRDEPKLKEELSSKTGGINALILVDIQRDFCPGGALVVPNGNEVVDVANRLLKPHGLFDFVVATQDWHPANHGSFASANGVPVFSDGELAGLPQKFWPDHCVQGSPGAEFCSDLNLDPVDTVVRKGTDCDVDSYSGFFDNGHRKSTVLNAFLESRGVKTVFIMGLALDFCVKFTALDAVHLGYEVYVIQDGCRGLSDESSAAAIAEMKADGIKMINSADILR